VHAPRWWALIALFGVSACGGSSTAAPNRPGSTQRAAVDSATTVHRGRPPSSTTTTTVDPAGGVPSDQRRLSKVHVITGGLTPKSVIYDGKGQMFAQNMIYSHTVNVYDRSFTRVAQISDSVDLTAFGHPGQHHGGPVEAAVSADGSHVYVTNYQMYGPGFTHPGDDACPKGNYDPSYVYRIKLSDYSIDQVIQVGPVPKYIATTPDGKWVLNSNWCGYDLSVIDAHTGKEVRRVPLGPYPRGIAVTPDSKTAFVAVMGTSDIAVIDLQTFAVSWIRGVGRGPRHLVLDPAGKYLYATLNAVGKVAKIDVATHQVLATVASAQEPRSMTIAPDGKSLYVVNYGSDAISKIRTSDMTQIQRLPTNHHPIGVAYDPVTDQVWVACYSGSIMIFSDLQAESP
jgi:YVTN family beta-propeller protein